MKFIWKGTRSVHTGKKLAIQTDSRYIFSKNTFAIYWPGEARGNKKCERAVHQSDNVRQVNMIFMTYIRIYVPVVC